MMIFVHNVCLTPGGSHGITCLCTCVHNFSNKPPNAGRMPLKVFQNPAPYCGSSQVRGVFFSSKSHSLLRMIGGGGKGPGYFLKTQAKSPTETANYKVTTTHSLRRDLLRGGVRAWQMFGANSYAFGGAFPSCLKTTCLFAPRGSRNLWARKTPLSAFLGHMCVHK